MIKRTEHSMNPSSRRVVITGLGVISPLGNTPEALWDALAGGRSGVGPLRSVPTDFLPTSFAAEAHGFSGSIDDFGPLEAEKKKALRKGLKVMCRECQMGLAAAQRALSGAGWARGGFDPERTGVVFGSDRDGFDLLLRAHDVFERRPELVGKAPMGHKY